ncbi:MAG TPA: DMT family transporter, partial [Polyangiaceae bacterium]|nr:DMT family transporter [Polyangiaceae bacterium]
MFRAETDVKRPLPSTGYASVALAAGSWGTWCVFLRLARSVAPVLPQLSTFVVMAIQVLVLLPSALRGLRRRLHAPSAAECALLVGFGVADELNCMLYFAALDTTSVAVAVLTHYAAPLLVALGAPLLLREPGRPGTLGAVLLGLFGLTLLLAPWRGAGSDPGLVRGALAGLGSAVSYAAGVLFNKRLSRSFEPAEL